MRRLPKPLLVELSKSLLRRPRSPLLPPPHRLLLLFSTHTLTPRPPPPSAAASVAEPTGIAALEAGEVQEADDHEKALGLALKALGSLQESHGGWSLPVARALRLAGAAAFRLGHLGDSLESLNAAAEILASMEGGRRGSRPEVAVVGAAVQEQLARTKTAMGRRWDAVADLRRALELKGMFLEEGSAALGVAYRDVSEAYAAVLDFEQALPLCLKALEIGKVSFGVDSVEVAKVRRLLVVVYTGLGCNVEALEQNELSRAVYGRLGLDAELSQVEVDGANMRILLGRLEEAMNGLKAVLQQASKESEERALAFVAMAKILCSQERFGDSKRCLEIAHGILNMKASVSPGRVAEVYAEISMLYEAMTEFEISLSLMNKTLAILEGVSEMQHIQGSISARMGWLLLLTKRVAEAVPYLETAVEMLKNCFGPKHFGLGFAYKHLGQAYLEMDKPQRAVKFLVLAKDIIDVAFGPKHEDSIDTNQCLANAYGLIGSYKLAMDFQQRVIDALESSSDGASEELREAHRLLEQLRKKAQGSPSAVFPANTLPVLSQNQK